MKVSLDPSTRRLEFEDLSWDDLDELVVRYGGTVNLGSGSDSPESDEGERDFPPGGAGVRRNNGNGQAYAADRVVLERLVSQGESGVPTQEIGEMLGRLGKSIRPALNDWSQRVRLIVDDTVDPFEECRCGNRRGVRLKSSMLHVARELLKST
jgi:hypothetical protein